MASFKAFHVSDIQLTVSQALSINPVLEPGAVTEEVEVRADQIPDVDLETSQVSNLVDAERIKELPLITRDPYQLVLLAPGTSQTDSRTGGFSVNGARDRNNNFLLDGVDNNDTSVPGAAAAECFRPILTRPKNSELSPTISTPSSDATTVPSLMW